VRRPIALFSIVLVTVLWSAALVAAPTGTAPRLAAVTYAAGSLVCHQRAERSFHHGGAQYPVCARCLGMYAGAMAGVLTWMALAGVGSAPRPRAAAFVARDTVSKALVVIAMPTLATVVSAWLGLWDAGNSLRAMLALPLGAVLAAVTAAVFAGDLR
jgi:uncharacterized membrane protein